MTELNVNTAPALVELEVEKIFPHPDNPRKELGDLTELAESIKARGIMQNLTVVLRGASAEDEYTVIIGHRRLAAAKLAGLKTVPCVITYLTEKEQLATMLLENMQRSDLTPFEQAQGMQLMMDLGESVKDIADKTGFSESTVRRRVKLMRYDRDEMMKVQVRQPTMEQYLKLSEIEDEDAANYALRFIGTKNFDAEVEKALKRQKEKKQRDELRAFVRTKAECISDGSYDNIQKLGVVSVESLYAPLTETNKKTLEDAILKYGKLYYVERYNFDIYRKKTEADKDVRAEAEKESKRHQALEYQADWIYHCMMGRADDFIKNYTPRKNDISILFAGFFEAKVWQRFNSNNSTPAAIELGYTVPEGRNSWESEVICEAAEYVIKKYEETPEKVLLVYLRKTLNLQRLYSFYFRAENITCTPQISRVYKLYFEILEKLGYCVSDEEWEFINGTHPIYSKKANDITDEEIISYIEEFADEDKS